MYSPRYIYISAMIAPMQVFEAVDAIWFLAVDPDVSAEAIGVIGHQFGLLCIDLHAEGCRSLVKALHQVS